MMKNDPTNLGSCCICEVTGAAVRNIVTVDKRVPPDESRGGWGCVVCGLEPFGAVAVLCDVCIDGHLAKKIEIKFACLGYPGENRRIELANLTEIYEHDASKHPESWNWEAALKHFREIRREYQNFQDMPGVNTAIALEHVFRPLSSRYHSGERTFDLYRAMMDCE